MTDHGKYMQRCLHLASLGGGRVSPNPMVGAVLVHENRIIGEGYHQQYGGPHAEVHAINSVPPSLIHLISLSTLYVSLEPCAHYGKTPPCADLIISHNIPRVVIGVRDPFRQVDGKGIEKLRRAGVEVITGVLEKECRHLNRRFFLFHTLHRPYIILKWAETADRKIGYSGHNRLLITGPMVNRKVHKWRSEEAAIMVGTNTAFLDNPMLTNRLWSGASPVRVVIDSELKLPLSLHLFDTSTRTIVFNTIKHGDENGIIYYQIAHDASVVHQVVNGLYQMNISSVIIEGGARLTQSFIDEEYWDEARIIINEGLFAGHGVEAPTISQSNLFSSEYIKSERSRILLYSREEGNGGI